jgi:plastocyanin
MTGQYVWIGMIIGVFFAGLAIGYVALYSTQTNYMHMTPQQMQQMMNNPQMMSQWHQTMMDNPQAFDSWMGAMMQNQPHMSQMMDTMMKDPQFGNWMMGSMMNDQNTMNGMMGTMMNNPQFMNRWMGTMMQNPNFQQQYMGPWMMMRDPQFMQQMGGQWFEGTDIESSAVETNKVSILADTWQYQSVKAFSPSVIKVTSGATVTWTNDDQVIHTVTDLGGSFDSGFIQAGETWDNTFDAKDTYYYFCSIHPWMKGIIVVS